MLRLRKAQQSSPPLSIYTPLHSPSEMETTFKSGCRSLCYVQVSLADSCMRMLWLASINIFNYHMTYSFDNEAEGPSTAKNKPTKQRKQTQNHDRRSYTVSKGSFLVLHCLFYSTYKQFQGSALLKLSPIIIIALFK